MSISSSPLSYLDCFDVMDKALQDSVGIRIRMADVDAATHFRMRCHQARKVNREENAKTYEDGEPLHNKSEYDILTLRIKTFHNQVYLYFDRTDITVADEFIEPLSALPAMTYEPPKQVEAPAAPQLVIESPEAFRRRV